MWCGAVWCAVCWFAFFVVCVYGVLLYVFMVWCGGCVGWWVRHGRGHDVVCLRDGVYSIATSHAHMQ